MPASDHLLLPPVPILEHPARDQDTAVVIVNGFGVGCSALVSTLSRRSRERVEGRARQHNPLAHSTACVSAIAASLRLFSTSTSSPPGLNTPSPPPLPLALAPSTPLPAAPLILNVRLCPLGRALKLKPRGRALPLALPPITGMS